MTSSTIIGGFHITKASDVYVIRKDDAIVGTQPTEELAIEWARGKADEALRAKYGKPKPGDH
jgi:hypothetical protein